MEQKVIIKICVGTYSYIMGGAQLMSLQEELPEQYKEKVKIEAVINLPNCEEGKLPPPYVQINEDLMTAASIVKIIEKLDDIFLKT